MEQNQLYNNQNINKIVLFLPVKTLCPPPSLSPPLLIELSWTDEQGGLAEAEEEEEVVSPPPAAAAVDRNILVGNGLSV